MVAYRDERGAAVVDYAQCLSFSFMLAIPLMRLGEATSTRLGMVGQVLGGGTAAVQLAAGNANHAGANGADGGGTDQIIRCGNACPPPPEPPHL
jgi:hypothetical protein